MEEIEMGKLLLKLIDEWENEIVEFKTADKNYDVQKYINIFRLFQMKQT